MTVKELCELDWTIAGLDIDVRNPTKLVETIRIGQTVRVTRYDKFKSEDGDIEIYERNLGVGQPLTIIRREIQWYNKPEKNKKGQTDTRKVGVDSKNELIDAETIVKESLRVYGDAYCLKCLAEIKQAGGLSFLGGGEK